MHIDKVQYLAPLNMLKRKDIEMLYKKTINAIMTISITYTLGVLLFIKLLLLNSSYSWIALLIPLLGYIWVISFGARHFNNRYGLKVTSQEVWVYEKKRESYATIVEVHILIFFITALVRLASEIKNLFLFRQELNREKASE